MATTAAMAGEAMETLKMKIGLLTKENKEGLAKLAVSEKAKAEAEARIEIAEKKIKDLSKQIHARKLLLDENTDKVLRNTSLAKKKEEATISAKEEIQTLTLKEMQLKTELEAVTAALPAKQAELTAASERADKQLAEVKRLEIRAMLTDQTIEEMEQQLYDAHNMSSTTSQRAEETARKLGQRTRELGLAETRSEEVTSKLDIVNGNLKAVDRKMAGIQFSLEDKVSQEKKYRKQISSLQEKIANAEQRSGRDEEQLGKLKERMEMIGVRRKAREERKQGK